MDELKIRELLAPILEVQNLFLVDLVIKGNEGNQKLIVLVDGDDGLTIDQCGSVSRELGLRIEEEELVDSKYTLEVSSPGLDFPLKLERQYTKNIGRELTVDLIGGEKVEGVLTSTSSESIKIMEKTKERDIPFENIKQSKVKISFK